jgi:hypothetical protein
MGAHHDEVSPNVRGSLQNSRKSSASHNYWATLNFSKLWHYADLFRQNSHGLALFHLNKMLGLVIIHDMNKSDLVI